ncbi:MAG: hypothetical protein AAF203_10345, partial [Pseudomonadota bacterium]
SLNEIIEIWTEMGLGLGMKIDGWPPANWDPNATPVRSTSMAEEETSTMGGSMGGPMGGEHQ